MKQLICIVYHMFRCIDGFCSYFTFVGVVRTSYFNPYTCVIHFMLVQFLLSVNKMTSIYINCSPKKITWSEYQALFHRWQLPWFSSQLDLFCGFLFCFYFIILRNKFSKSRYHITYEV